jgi:metal-responsive CopG/Arc/MetJ family transcriptional regulator
MAKNTEDEPVNETESKQMWITILVEKDLVKDFDKVAKDLDTDRSKLIRQRMRETVEDHKHARRLKASVQSRQIVRRTQV